jgi:putative NADPH-quinone reductase
MQSETPAVKAKKALVITAHPSTKGFTHRIAEAYARGVRQAGGEVEILDLYTTDLKQDFLRFELVREIAPDPVRTTIQAKITAADELVFIHPLWWLGPPAIMKNFLDQNISARFAFQYVQGKRVGC